MKVLILTGSPHTHGTTSLLADEVLNGAKEAGHEVVRFDTAKLDIHPCLGCDYCRKNDGQCIYDDDMTQIYPHLLDADVIVLVTPVYYFGLTAQLKRTIDRFYSVNSILLETPKRMLLVAACGDKEEWAIEPLVEHYKAICRYLHWQEGGTVLAIGAYTRSDVEGSVYQVMARELGAKI